MAARYARYARSVVQCTGTAIAVARYLWSNALALHLQSLSQARKSHASQLFLCRSNETRGRFCMYQHASDLHASSTNSCQVLCERALTQLPHAFCISHLSSPSYSNMARTPSDLRSRIHARSDAALPRGGTDGTMHTYTQHLRTLHPQAGCRTAAAASMRSTPGDLHRRPLRECACAWRCQQDSWSEDSMQSTHAAMRMLFGHWTLTAAAVIDVLA